MQIILTHEHSDFDAVAAQLAAHKVTPQAIPVIADRLHWNVRQFITLYGDQLPFRSRRGIPRESVEKVIIVDTQHFQSPRGLRPDTPISVIDHHPRGRSIKPGWDVLIDEVGATTTLLVEQMQEAQVTLTPLEATLLALGIYEDTGALTYSTTTSRDSQAAAWLIGQGVWMDVLREFLQFPLADDQQKLLERLLSRATVHQMHGHTVVIAAADGRDLKNEISVLAHKVRDLYDTEAIFMLVQLERYIQLVARSSSSSIDVEAIAGRFGGGGHSRAAAARIAGMELDQAIDQLIQSLPGFVRPAKSVGDIMSEGVQTLTPDQTVSEADAFMRRYGYEGFPVVRDGRVVGLITRRAVDRAVAHGLAPERVDRIMAAGEVRITQNAPISALQRLMIETGWGQVPVVDTHDRIVGVVTRTDLIKHIGYEVRDTNETAHIVELLEQALSPAMMALVRFVGQLAHEKGSGLFVIGGFVRDLLLRKPTSDIDFVVEGDAIELAHALRRQFGGAVRIHDRFGTAKWQLGKEEWKRITDAVRENESVEALPNHIDFATARTEFYKSPTVLPEVEQSSIKLDLHRRDFTINTLAISLSPIRFGQILDFYQGQADLRAGLIRVLHSLSFIDDPTRILRAVRFEQRLGFRIEARTEELIAHAVPLIARVSGDRIRHELNLIFLEEYPEQALCRLHNLGALQAIHPALHCDNAINSRFAAIRHAITQAEWPAITEDFDPTVAYFGVLTAGVDLPVVQEICDRLQVKRQTMHEVVQLHSLLPHIITLSRTLLPSEIDGILSGSGDSALLALWALCEIPARSTITRYARELRYIRPKADGHTLKSYGLSPGPRYRDILQTLRYAWLDGKVATVEEETALLQRLVGEAGP